MRDAVAIIHEMAVPRCASVPVYTDHLILS